MSRRLLCIVALAGLGLPAAAQGVRPPGPGQPLAADRAQIMSCLGQSPAERAACIGLVAVPCTLAARNDSGAAVACARREEAVWRERLTALVRAVAGAVGEANRGRFQALQLGWEGHAAQECAFRAGLQPPARAGAVQAGCELRVAANRAIELERLLAARRSARPQPPAILR